MAMNVVNKDRVPPLYNERHILTPAEMQNNATAGATAIKGSPSSNPAYTPRTQ